jgi:type VI protein secretion system component VasK
MTEQQGLDGRTPSKPQRRWTVRITTAFAIVLALTTLALSAPVSSPSSEYKPQRRWTDWITSAFTVVLALATLALVGSSIWQHFDARDAITVAQASADAAQKTLVMSDPTSAVSIF